ncbi:MAG: hypothetical protein ACKVJ1_06895 [Verrucomicrobiia bacterium]
MHFYLAVQYSASFTENLMAKGKTITIRVPEQTFDEIKGVCSDLGDAYNFNQFVNQSLSAMLEVIHHDGEQVPIPKFVMMARLMKNYEESVFRDKKADGEGN